MVTVPKGSRTRSWIVPVALSLAAANAHAIPRPPQQIHETNVRVLLGYHARAVIQGEDLLLNGTKIPGTSVFNIRCGTEQGSSAAYVEYGAGRRAVGRLEITAPVIKLNDRAYRSRLSVIPQGPACEVVNSVELEKYIAGVIAREMSPSWPQEALKAQAVASRSYATYQIWNSKGRDYDVESGTQDQVYEGAAAEDLRSIQAVEATRGLALVYGDSALKAYFHANCGGVTEVPELVWGGDPKAFRSVVCPYHKRPRDRISWSALVTRSQLESALHRIAGILPRGFLKVASIAEGAPDGSHRLSDISVSDTAGNSVLISSNTFRNALGNTRLKSTAFHIHRDPAGFRIDGEGNGHGVGLCQVGARAMAEEGKTFRQILQFYYPLAKIQPVR